jgi:hypothetical protein
MHKGMAISLLISLFSLAPVCGCDGGNATSAEEYDAVATLRLALSDDVLAQGGTVGSADVSKDEDGVPRASAPPSYGQLTAGEYRSLLRARVDVGNSDIVLTAKEPAIDQGTIAEGPHVSAFIGSVPFLAEQGLGEEYVDGTLNVFGDPAAESGYVAVVDAAKGSYYAKSWEMPVAGTPSGISKEDLLMEAKYYIGLLGASVDEMGDVRVTRLMRRTLSDHVPGTGATSAMSAVPLEHVVYIHRSINGIRVPADKFVVSFFLDGRVRKVSGQWRSVNYGASQFVSAYESEEEIVEAVVDFLVEQKINPYSAHKIRLMTVYDVVPEGDSLVLDLKLGVRVPKESGDGGYTPESYLVDI